MEFLQTLLDSHEIIHTGGLILISLVVFAECGLFFGFFLPGDYLLFSAGLLCGTKDLNIPIVILLLALIAASVAGNFVGYFFGKKVGRKLFMKKNSIIFKYEHLIRTRAYYLRYGGNTLIVARFFPIIRTFAPILAGVVEMNLKKFSLYNILGGIAWIGSLVLAGFYLGRRFPQLINYLEYIIIGFLVVTTFVLVRTFLKMRVKKKVKRKVA